MCAGIQFLSGRHTLEAWFDEDGDAGWFSLGEGMAIQGLAASDRSDQICIYVVTERPPIELPQVKGRWPRMVHLASDPLS